MKRPDPKLNHLVRRDTRALADLVRAEEVLVAGRPCGLVRGLRYGLAEPACDLVRRAGHAPCSVAALPSDRVHKDSAAGLAHEQQVQKLRDEAEAELDVEYQSPGAEVLEEAADNGSCWMLACGSIFLIRAAWTEGIGSSQQI